MDLIEFLSFTTATGWTASILNAGLRRTLNVRRDLHDDWAITPQSENFQVRGPRKCYHSKNTWTDQHCIVGLENVSLRPKDDPAIREFEIVI